MQKIVAAAKYQLNEEMKKLKLKYPGYENEAGLFSLNHLILLTTIILFFLPLKDLCMMWITIIIFLLLILSWLFLTPLELRVDTRTPQASLQWFSIGKAIVIYENEKWWLKMRVLFFYKQWDLEKLIFPDKKKKKRVTRIQKKRKRGKIKWLRRFPRLLKTFRVTKWQIALDTGDNIKTAWLYPLNFFSDTRQHLYINFNDENYLVLNVRNTPWKIGYAFLR